MNETFTLSLIYDDQIDSSRLDLNPLETDFEILTTSPQSSSAVSIINGKTTRKASTIWTVTLAPKRPGKLIIPELTINNVRSQSITVQASAQTGKNATGQPLQVWVSADSDSVYPSQQLLVEVEISAQSNVSNLNGPQLIVNDAEVEPLGQQSFQRIDNGIARQIIVLKYAVFAKQAGELVIPIMTYSAVQGGGRSLFGPAGKQVVARSSQLTIPVKEAVTKDNTPWFPANEVSISANWSADPKSIKVGEPITRTIKITAHGQRASVIPPLSHSTNSNNYKSYKDQPQLDSQSTADGFVSTRTESEAIVPSSAGELYLPELRLSWWNVKTQRWQDAVLEAETITVAVAPNASEDPRSVDPIESAVDGDRGAQTIATTSGNDLLWKLATAVFALVCLIQMWFILRLRRQPPNVAVTNDTTNVSELKSWKSLGNALKGNDAANIRKGLISWANAALPEQKPVSLHSLANYSNQPELKTELANLDRHLYKDTGQFDATGLTTALKTLRGTLINKDNNATNRAKGLKPLYSVQ